MMLELSQLTTKQCARGLRPRIIPSTPDGLETTITEVLETEQVKGSFFKTKVGHFLSEGQKSQIMLAVLNLDKS